MAITRSSVPGASRPETLCCSFCIKDKDAVAKLIAGPGVYICNECVDLCCQIIADQPASERSCRFRHIYLVICAR